MLIESTILNADTNLLNVDTVAGAAKDQTGLHCLCESLCLGRMSTRINCARTPSTYLKTDLLLFFPWEIDKVVVLGSNKKGYCGLVEASALPVPFLDGV